MSLSCPRRRTPTGWDRSMRRPRLQITRLRVRLNRASGPSTHSCCARPHAHRARRHRIRHRRTAPSTNASPDSPQLTGRRALPAGRALASASGLPWHGLWHLLLGVLASGHSQRTSHPTSQTACAGVIDSGAHASPRSQVHRAWPCPSVYAWSPHAPGSPTSMLSFKPPARDLHSSWQSSPRWQEGRLRRPLLLWTLLERLRSLVPTGWLPLP